MTTVDEKVEDGADLLTGYFGNTDWMRIVRLAMDEGTFDVSTTTTCVLGILWMNDPRVNIDAGGMWSSPWGVAREDLDLWDSGPVDYGFDSYESAPGYAELQSAWERFLTEQ